MTRSLVLKLTLAFLLVSLLGIALVAVFGGQFAAREFGRFALNQDQTAISARLADYHRARGRWEGIEARNIESPDGTGYPPAMHGFVLADASGRVIVPGPGYPPGEQLSAEDLARGRPVDVDGQVVGTVLFAAIEPRNMPQAASAAAARFSRTLGLAAIGAGVIALGVGGVLARALTRPLKALTQAAHAIAQGDLEQRVEVRSRDELGELAASFNQMSADLSRGSQLRRQMTADIAHELRTPLSLIQAHAEGLRDGVLPPTSETFCLIHDEALRLNRLVEDLRTLSLADARELSLVRRSMSPGQLLERAAAAQAVRAQQQGVALQTVVAPDLPEVEVDPDRMAQVLGNLFDNALRHTPPGGRVEGQATRGGPGSALPVSSVRFVVADTGPGVPLEDLPYVFERLYRADKSRQRNGNGSGLGLAIAKSIVDAHGGRIWVESQPGAGARFIVELPAAPEGIFISGESTLQEHKR